LTLGLGSRRPKKHQKHARRWSWTASCSASLTAAGMGCKRSALSSARECHSCESVQSLGREGGRENITGSVSGGWEFKRPPIHPSILHRLKFCCGDYIASARAHLPQACRLNSSRDDFEARGSGSCSKKASSVQPCNRARLGVRAWYCGGTVVGLERYPSRCRNLVSRFSMALQRWQAGRQKVEWSGIMGWGIGDAIILPFWSGTKPQP
jgi:hypothetical protein